MDKNREPKMSQLAHPPLQRLLEPGLIGLYKWFEVIKIGAMKEGESLNVFTIYIAIESDPPENREKKSQFLNGKDRKEIEGYSFGIIRQYVTANALLEAASRFDTEGVWRTHNDCPTHGKLGACAPAFYAPDGTESVPLNRILKNNFWNGSHIVELADAAKDRLFFLIKNPDALNELGTWVNKYIHIDIASVVDRLGNIIIQLPVTSLAVSFGREREVLGTTVAWHPEIAPRRISGTINLNFDKAVVAYGEKGLNEGYNPIASDISNRPFIGYVWDAEKEILLAANPPTVFMGGGPMSMSTSTIGSGLKRVFHEPTKESSIRREIALSSPAASTRFWSGWSSRPNGAWTERRISDTEIQRLVDAKRFVQYGGLSGSDAKSEHERALADIRTLINWHGDHAVYLWDPYLSSADLLATLFHCSRSDIELRALTAGKAIEREEFSCWIWLRKLTRWFEKSGSSKRERWVLKQNAELQDSIEGDPNIKLEFRISYGQKAWSFHDRFIIFPQTPPNKPLAWSLGASINHLGAAHAIIQEVAHPVPVLKAFESLWECLNANDHLIWKSPT